MAECLLVLRACSNLRAIAYRCSATPPLFFTRMASQNTDTTSNQLKYGCALLSTGLCAMLLRRIRQMFCNTQLWDLQNPSMMQSLLCCCFVVTSPHNTAMVC